MKIQFFWDVTQCLRVSFSRCFEGMYCLRLQGFRSQNSFL